MKKVITKCFGVINNSDYVELNQDELSICRVCGYDYGDYFPWGENGRTPDYTHCVCCGVEFGYSDFSYENIKRLREVWISNRYPWLKPDKKPSDWSAENSLARIPKVFI